MKEKPKKILGEERRNLILQWLETEGKPLTGNDLAKRTNVSRQIIVQDISLLKAKNFPILATAQGYVFMKELASYEPATRLIACKHKPEQTEHELSIIIDYGGSVRDVTIEHPLYGDLTVPLLIRNRIDLQQFINKVSSTNASLLSELTEGVHLHTIEAESTTVLDQICQTLSEAGYLLQEND